MLRFAGFSASNWVERRWLFALALGACSATAPAEPRGPTAPSARAPTAPAPSVRPPTAPTPPSAPAQPTPPASSSGTRGPTPPASPTSPTAPTPARSPLPPSSATKPVKPAGKASADAGPSACPSGMVLVDGDYCTDVDYECLRSWYDKSNKKTVCEEFKPESKCVGKKVKKRFCIDMYTWPNEKGARPEVMNRFHQAELKCAALGKRLCTESEWTLACEGPRMLPFPYGYSRDTNKCLGDVEWDAPDMKKVAARDPDELARLWKGVRNGAQPECISEFGVADLPGNVDEVVSNETTDGSWREKYDSVHTGGPWYKGTRNQCRPKIYTHDEGFYYYFLGFRCCSEPDGKPTDFRTPKQVKEKWKLERIERQAGHTLEDVKTALEKKRKGECKCSEHDTRCKTLCGTLLGPSTKDYR